MERATMQPRRVGVWLCVAVLIAACGSTVRQDAGVGGPAQLADGTGLDPAAGLAVRPGGAATGTPATAGGAPGDGTTGAGRPSGAGSGGGTSAGAGSAGTASGPAPGAAGGPPPPGGAASGPAPGAAPGPLASPATGRGFDETTIALGMGRAEDDSAGALAALGINVAEVTIDEEAALQAIIDDINGRGGIGGRHVMIVWHDIDLNEALFNPSTAAQAACATWTEDNQVFAVTFPGLAFVDLLVACLHQQGTPLIHPSGIQGDGRSYQDFYDTYPLYYAPGSMEAGLYDRIAMRRLVERGFFEPWDTVAGGPASGPTAAPMRLGVNIRDTERGDQRLASLTAELARYGIEIETVTRQSPNIANAATDAQAAMLRFRADGITHIFSVGVFHHTVAEQQGYRPRYFFDHDALATVAMTSPAAQLRGAMGASLIPTNATDETSYPGHPEGYLPCLAVVEAAGVTPSTTIDHFVVQQFCDALYPLQAAIAAGGELSNAGLQVGFTALGTRPISSVTWTSQFTDRQRASAVGLRDISFVEACTCFAYDSDVTHFE